MPKGKLFVISGSSGVGKGTLVNALLNEKRDICLSVSTTTRLPRVGEKNGVNYFFVTEEEFKKSLEKDKFLEYANFGGNFYGTSKKFVSENINSGKDVLLEIDVAGAMKVFEKMPESIGIFILPPSFEELERRLRSRGTETEENIQKRLAAAQREIAQKDKYKYNLINDNLETAVNELIQIFDKERGILC